MIQCLIVLGLLSDSRSESNFKIAPRYFPSSVPFSPNFLSHSLTHRGNSGKEGHFIFMNFFGSHYGICEPLLPLDAKLYHLSKRRRSTDSVVQSWNSDSFTETRLFSRFTFLGQVKRDTWEDKLKKRKISEINKSLLTYFI